MSARRRAPSKRALEAAQDTLVDDSVVTEPAARISRGHAPIKGLQDDDMKGSAGASQEEPAEPDFTLYCICLGFDTGEQPMIECGSCHNWFHFNCVGLNEQSASQIEAYCCDICQEMGMGQTRTVNDAPISAHDYDGANLSSPSLSGTFDDDDDDSDNEPPAAELDDEEYRSDPVTTSGGVKRARKAASAPKRARRKVEGDEEYVEGPEAEGQHTLTTRSGSKVVQTPKAPIAQSRFYRKDEEDEEVEASPKSKGKKARKSLASAAPPAPIAPANAPSAPPSDKTRTHCVSQLTVIFKSIFATSEGEVNSTGVEVRAAAFAESVEAELFEGFAELDPKGVRSPRTKYVAKFRSLHFNLKTNAVFRSRISSNDLNPAQIVNMSNEDLLTPELRAMAESVRAASLKHSVKEVISAPTAKRTHKGEEEIDNHAAVAAAQEERAAAELEKRQRAESISRRSPQQSPRIEASPFFRSPPVESPATTAGSPPNRFPSSRPRSSLPTSAIPISAEELGLDVSDETPIKPAMHQRQTSGSAHPFDSASPSVSAGASPAPAPQDGEMRPPPAPQARSRSSFDMSSVWSKIKAAPQGESSETPEPKEGESEEGAAAEVEEEPPVDPFAPKTSRGDDDDDFEAALLRGEGSTKRATTPPMRRKPLSELSTVWTGDLIVPDEGGFPASGVQAAGRPFGAASQVWEQLLPRGLTMDGRIPTQTAYKYLLECSFASTRELIVVALLPDLGGPTEAAPLKPSKEKALAKHAHVINFYTKKDRIGVIAPAGALKKVVKDIYILPLRQREPLPEWAELLDDSNIPEVSERDGDLLLCVLVVQKGVIPTVRPAPEPKPVAEPVPFPVSAPELTPAPAPVVVAPLPQPQVPATALERSPLPHAQPPYASQYQPPPVSAYSPNGYGPPPLQSYDSAPYSRGPPPPSHYKHQPSPYAPPPQHSPPYPQQSPPYGGARSPPYDPSAQSNAPPAIDASLLANIDTSALNSLLANPSLLQSALAQTQQQVPPPTQQYQQGYGSPQHYPPQQQQQQQQQWGGPPQQQRWEGQQQSYGYDSRQQQGGAYGSGYGGGGYESQGYGGGQSPPSAGRAGYVHPSRAALLDPSAGGSPQHQHQQQQYAGQRGGYGGGYQQGGHQQGYGQQGRGGWGGRGR